MAESTRLVDLVQHRLDAFLGERAGDLGGIAGELGSFIDFSRELLAGGKRFRALFCYWGWEAVASAASFDPLEDPSTRDDFDAVVSTATALEMFHAAALVHDDIMDKSDTRRGGPSAHRRFEHLHRDAGWLGSGPAFGQSGALLLGDLLLGWSDEILDSGLAALPRRAVASAARAEFNRMRTEVTVGQYLDVLEEVSWLRSPEAELLPRAHRVIVYKSAKYSVEAPLVIGATLAGGSPEQIAALRGFGLPLGVAYQLRDDLLGVYGNPEVTGKPSGDDLREGKRTILIALARAALPGNLRRVLDELLGDPELDSDQIGMLQAAIRESGAVEKVERIIDRNVAVATESLDSAGGIATGAALSASARHQLGRLAETVARRSS